MRFRMPPAKHRAAHPAGHPAVHPVTLAALLVATLVLAGCGSPGPAGTTTPAPVVEGIEADFVTPGVWDVRGHTDYMMAWAHNVGNRRATVAWSLTGPDGGELPEGWNVTMEKTESVLGALGARGQGEGSKRYADWDRNQLTLRIPAQEPGASHPLELRVGSHVQPVTVIVHERRGAVAGPGANVNVDTVGTFASDGSEFWRGEFETVVGGQGAVEGVAFGLMGVTAGETVALHVPPPFAYGYDNDPGGQHYQFNGQTLVFTMRMTKWS